MACLCRSGAADEYLETLYKAIRAKINLFHKRCRLQSHKSLKKKASRKSVVE